MDEENQSNNKVEDKNELDSDISQESGDEESLIDAESGEEDVQNDDEGLPFPRARVVNIIKNEIGRDKQIRSEVKEAINIWLGDLLKRIARDMANTQYASIGIADFQRATKPYDMIVDIIKDEERLMLSVEKLKSDSDHILRELSRFFDTIKGSKKDI